jgi:predicted transcriptional regulator
MTDLILEVHDRFAVLYDLALLIEDGVAGEDTLASSTQLSRNVVRELLMFMLAQGYIKTIKSDSEFKITVLGSKFLRDFEGMRKFLS